MIRRVGCGAWRLAIACAGAVRLAAGTTTERAPAYDVPLECPARGHWLEALRARLPPLLRTHPLVEAQRVHIERVSDSGGRAYEGFLESSAGAESGGSTPVVRGADCTELIDVLSFMGALGLERIAGQPEALPAPAESSRRSSVDVLAAVGTDRSPSRPDSEKASAPTVGAMLFALVQNGIAPRQSLDFGVGGRLAWSAPGWQPLLLFGVYSGSASEVTVGGAARVRFEHWSTQAVACPWRFPSQGGLGVRPCVDLDVGMTRGSGSGVARAEAHAAPWVSGGAQLRFEVALGDRLELGASLGATQPLYHARFFIKPSSTAFETNDFVARTGTYVSLLF